MTIHLWGHLGVLPLPLLLDMLVKGSIILLAGFATAGLLRKSSAASRHFVWGAAIAAALLLPLFSLVLPEWTIELPVERSLFLAIHSPKFIILKWLDGHTKRKREIVKNL